MYLKTQSLIKRPTPDAGSRIALTPTRAATPDAPHGHQTGNAGHEFQRISIFPPAAQDSAPIQRKAEDTEEADGGEAEMQLKSDGGAPARPNVPAAGGVGGSPLPPPVRNKMEASFGHSFADVRIHSGDEAKTVGALAYTRGTDIHFQPGLYDPSSLGGQELLGHELAHVVQQGAGRVSSPGGGSGTAPINADTGLEVEADAMGRRAAQGEAAPVHGAGGGIQRKAMSDAPIQREEDEEEKPKAYELNAPTRRNEFLPSRVRPRQLVNTSPERSKVRYNGDGSVFQPDVVRVNTFRNRMGGEMTAQKNTMATNDQLAADSEDKRIGANPLAKPGPAGWGGFVADQQAGTRAELSALSAGTLGSGPARTDAQGRALTNTAGIVPQTSGEFERLAVPPRPNGYPRNRAWNPDRPAATQSEIAPSKSVTQGATESSTPYLGGGWNQVSTLSGGRNAALENKLEHPTTLRDAHGNDLYPRQGMQERQTGIMETAKKADPLMRQLATTNILPTHVPAMDRHMPGGWLQAGDQLGDDKIKNSEGADKYAVGMDFFADQRTIRPFNNPNPGNRVETLLPNVTNWDSAAANAAGTGNRSRPNVWSEADVDPARVAANNPEYHRGRRRVVPRVRLEERNEERLLHTHPNTRVNTPDNKGGMTSGPVDHRFYVTNDHYKSAVPVAPLAEGYKANRPPTQQYPLPYMDKTASGQSSLEVQDAKAAGLSQEAAGVDRDLRFNASLPYRTATGEAAKASTITRDAKEETRSQGIETELASRSPYGDDDTRLAAAEKAGAERDTREVTRNIGIESAQAAMMDKKLAAPDDERLAAARTASAGREAAEEAATQADLKALAPSRSVAAMYGSDPGTMAANEIEIQHAMVKEHLARPQTGGPQPVAPMSEAAADMYG